MVRRTRVESLKFQQSLSKIMTIEIREFQLSDTESIEEMILKAENFGIAFFDHEMLRINVYTSFPQYGRILVAFVPENGEVAGYIAIQFDWKVLVINSIITHHNHLRSGIGRIMIEKVKEIGKKHTFVDVIRVDTGDFMEYAQKFYLSCGFQKAGHVPHYLSWNNHQEIFVYQLKK